MLTIPLLPVSGAFSWSTSSRHISPSGDGGSGSLFLSRERRPLGKCSRVCSAGSAASCIRPASRSTSASSASGRSKSPTTTTDPSRGQPRVDRGGTEVALALQGAPADRRATDHRHPGRLHAARAGREPGARCSACATSTSRTTPSTRPSPSRIGRSRSPSTKAREFGFDTLACASTGNLAGSVAAHARARPACAPSSSSRPTWSRARSSARDLRADAGRGGRQLRRRQPPVQRDRRQVRLGVREHQHAAVLLRGQQDARLRGRRAARLAAPGPRDRADRQRLACSRRSGRGSRSWSSLG